MLTCWPWGQTFVFLIETDLNKKNDPISKSKLDTRKKSWKVKMVGMLLTHDPYVPVGLYFVSLIIFSCQNFLTMPVVNRLIYNTIDKTKLVHHGYTSLYLL